MSTPLQEEVAGLVQVQVQAAGLVQVQVQVAGLVQQAQKLWKEAAAESLSNGSDSSRTFLKSLTPRFSYFNI